MDATETGALVSLICMGLSFLGITGIDAGMVSSVITGIVSFIGCVSVIYTWYQHRVVKTAAIAAGAVLK